MKKGASGKRRVLFFGLTLSKGSILVFGREIFPRNAKKKKKNPKQDKRKKKIYFHFSLCMIKYAVRSFWKR